MRRSVILLSTLLAAAALEANAPGPGDAGQGDAPRPADGQTLFLAAMQRVRTHAAEPPDPAALKEYPIYDYLLAARLRRDLAAAPSEPLDALIDQFLSAHQGQPVAHSLQNAWLANLAERGRWGWFLPRATEVTDPALICDRLAGRLATGDTAGLAADALARWNLVQPAPRECGEIFTWLRTQGLLTPALRESRARAALAQEKVVLAREFVAEVPAERAAPLRQWLELLEDPKPVLARLAADPDIAVEPDALLAGFTRLARSNPAAADALLPALLQRSDPGGTLGGRLRRAAALGDAFGRQSGAVAAFESLPAAAIDAPVEEWRVRAALWAGNYERALAWIDEMPGALASQPRWRYWRARATAAVKGPDAAQPLFADLAGLRDYYGYLAADRAHQDYHLNMRPTADDPQILPALSANPGLIRAHALFECELTDDAGAEWNAALAAAKPAVKVQAARLASGWGWYAQAIMTLAQANEWDDVMLRYPRPYAEIIAQASKFAQVPPDWILAIMRQESLFRRDAVSRADARGLMQMLPATAVTVARRWHLRPPGRDALFDPAVAVPLGAAYVRELLDRYTDQLALALAAYNAGPAAVARWQPPQRLDADVWIENIPYSETRAYVQHILEHIVAFAAVSEARPPQLATLLPPIAPAGAAASAPTAP